MPIQVEEIIYAWMAEKVCSEDSQEVYHVIACAEMDGGQRWESRLIFDSPESWMSTGLCLH